MSQLSFKRVNYPTKHNVQIQYMNLLLYCTLQRVSTVHLPDDDWSGQPKKSCSVYTRFIPCVWTDNWHRIEKYTSPRCHPNSLLRRLIHVIPREEIQGVSFRVLTLLEAEVANRIWIYLYLQSGNSTIYLVSVVAYYVWFEFIMLLIRPWKCEHMFTRNASRTITKV